MKSTDYIKKIFITMLFLTLIPFMVNAEDHFKPEMVLQIGHTGFVYSFVFSPDGKYALSASGDKTMKLWDIASGKEIRTFTGHSHHVSIAAFSPDNKYALSGSYDSTIKLWDLASGKELRTFAGHTKLVYIVAFSPDGKYAFSRSQDYSMRLWDISSGKELKTLHDYSDIRSAIFSPDGKYILTGSDDKLMKLWDLASGKVIKTYSGHSGSVKSVAFSPDGKYILSGSDDKLMKLWDLASGKVIKTYSGHSGSVKSVAFSPDGKYILSGADDSTLKLWDVATGKEMRTLTGHTYNIYSVAFSSDGKYAMSGAFCDSNVVTWDIATGKEIREFVAHADRILSAAFSSDGKHAMSGSMYTGIKLWDVACGKESGRYSDRILFAAFSPDGRYALSVPWDQTMSLLDMATGREIIKFEGYYNETTSAVFSPDGKYVLAASNDKPSRLLDAGSGKLIRTFTGHRDTVYSAAFSPDSRYALTGSGDKTIKLWDVASDREIKTFTGHDGDIESVLFLPGGRRFLSGSSDRTIKLWDIATGKAIRTFAGHSDYVTSLALSPDGKYILSGSADRTLKLWDVATGKEMKTFTGHSGYISEGVFSPDGKNILSGSADKTIRIWNMETGKWVAFIGHRNGKDWFVFDSDGYWDSSRHGGDLVAVVSGMDCWNIDQFAVKNNRPDLILEKLPGHDNGLAMEYYRQYKKRIAKLEKLYGIKEPDLSSGMHVPKAEIVSAEQKEKIFSLSIKLTDTVYNIVSYNIYVNDVPVYTEIGKKIKRNRELSITETIELSEGENKVEVSCFNEKGVESYRSLAFAYYEGKKKSSLYFIGFGVCDYRDESINDLRYSENDVLDLAGKFSSMKDSYDKIYIKTYTGDNVTSANIKGAKDFLEGAGVDDTVILFISGHGIHDDDEYKTYYYIMQKTDVNNLKGTAADFDTVEDILAGINPRKKLFLMDTCDSGELDDFAGEPVAVYDDKCGGKGIPRTPKGMGVKFTEARGYFDRGRFIYNDLFRRAGAIVFSSSKGGEASWEYDSLKNGAFTEAVLEGLSGGADADGNGIVTIDELQGYVGKFVDGYTEGKQHPVIDRDNIYVKFELPVK